MRVRCWTLTGAVLTAAVLAAAAVAGSPASLRVVRDAPLTLRGTGFRAHESVRVIVVMGQRTLARTVRAGSAGGFTARFTVRLDRCATPLRISARRDGGAIVRARLPVAECAMP